MSDIYNSEKKIRKNLDCDEVCKILTEKRDTLILSHVNPDCDTLGSAFALKLLLEGMGMRAFVCCADELPQTLEFMNFPQKSILFSSLPPSFTPERIIAADVASPSQLGWLRKRFEEHTDLMIDHHSMGTPFADNNYIDDGASAVGEIIFGISKKLLANGSITEIPSEVYRYIYAAISADTGCFKYSNVTPATHAIAAELISHGFDFAQINFRIHDYMTPADLTLYRIVLSEAELCHNGKIAYILFPHEKLAALGIPYEHYSSAIDIIRRFGGIEVAFVVRQKYDDNIFHVSMRSCGDTDVSSICAAFGGGGHAKSAGVTFGADNIETAAACLIKEIEKVID